MKKTITSALAAALALVFILCFASCASDLAKVWENATYKEDVTLGEGAKTAVIEVKVGDNKVTFTVKTDKDTVGEALLEHGLISGDPGPYGLYVKTVNGMTADYDVDQSYWALYINGESAMVGVDGAEIAEGSVYTLEYTK